MNRQFHPLLMLITFIAAIFVVTYGLTVIIEMNVLLSNTMYSVGHEVGAFIRGIFK